MAKSVDLFIARFWRFQQRIRLHAVQLFMPHKIVFQTSFSFKLKLEKKF